MKDIYKILLVISLSISSTATFATDWQAITGVPEPTFGFKEVSPTLPSDWNTDKQGFYYIDRTNPLASDSNNYGNLSKPRSSIPSSIPAGSVVIVNGSYAKLARVTSLGTADRPVFIKGISRDQTADFSAGIQISGSYLIIENFKTVLLPPDYAGGGISIPEGTDHIVLRYGELDGTGNNNRTGGIEVGSWSYSGTEKADNIVLHNLSIHDLGDRYTTYDQDAHGIAIHGKSENIWIVHNTMTKLSGDGVQVEAQHTRSHENIQKVYLAKNTIFNNKQSGLWLKHAKKVVISSNTIYDMQASDSSSGQCTGYQYSSDDFWFIENELYNCGQGIMGASDDGNGNEQGNVYYLRNLIYNIKSQNPTNPHQAGGITIRMPRSNHYVIGNTIDKADFGISSPTSNGQLFIYNNIFTNKNIADNADVYLESSASNSFIDNNIIYNPGEVKIAWNSTFNSVSQFQEITQQCKNCIQKDPSFKNQATADYTLTDNSIAINKGKNIDSIIFSSFETAFGFALKFKDGDNIIPVSTWDIGAKESGSITFDNKPNPPSNVEILPED